MSRNQVSVVGLGLIGGSLGAALRQAGMKVRGFDPAPESKRLALERELVDDVSETLEAAVQGAEVVILAAPVLAIVDLLRALDLLLPEDAVVLDTGSVKGPIVAAMAELRAADRAIGGHPLAGKERSGAQAAEPDLFQGYPFALVPSRRTSDATLYRAHSLVRSVGAHPVVVDAERHDTVLSRTSHLPQLLSTALALSLEREDELLAGPGLRDMTRLAGSEPGIWRDILLANRERVVAASHRYIGTLEELVRVVESADAAGIEGFMRQGQLSCLDFNNGEKR